MTTDEHIAAVKEVFPEAFVYDRGELYASRYNIKPDRKSSGLSAFCKTEANAWKKAYEWLKKVRLL